MSKAAAAVGADGLLIEVHPCPERALSDGPQSLDLQGFQELMEGWGRRLRAKQRRHEARNIGPIGLLGPILRRISDQFSKGLRCLRGSSFSVFITEPSIALTQTCVEAPGVVSSAMITW